MPDAVDRPFDEGKALYRRLLQSRSGTGSIVFWARNHKPAGHVDYHEQRTFIEDANAVNAKGR